MDLNKVVREYLSRRTPDGYYVVTARLEAKEILSRLTGGKGVEYEELADTLIVKVRARSLAEEIIRILYRRKLLV